MVVTFELQTNNFIQLLTKLLLKLESDTTLENCTSMRLAGKVHFSHLCTLTQTIFQYRATVPKELRNREESHSFNRIK